MTPVEQGFTVPGTPGLRPGHGHGAVRVQHYGGAGLISGASGAAAASPTDARGDGTASARLNPALGLYR